MRLGSLAFMDRPHTAVAQHLRPTPQFLRCSMRRSSGAGFAFSLGDDWRTAGRAAFRIPLHPFPGRAEPDSLCGGWNGYPQTMMGA